MDTLQFRSGYERFYMPNRFINGTRVYLVLRLFNKAGVKMVAGMSFYGDYLELPISQVAFNTKRAA